MSVWNFLLPTVMFATQLLSLLSSLKLNLICFIVVQNHPLTPPPEVSSDQCHDDVIMYVCVCVCVSVCACARVWVDVGGWEWVCAVGGCR